MKKAKIIFSIVIFFAVAGGALAFKASRVTGFKVVTHLFSVAVGTVVYSTNVPFCTTTAIEFIAPIGEPEDLTITWVTAANAPTFAVTLRRTSPPTTQTITIPAHTTCTLITAYLTPIN